MNSHNLTTLYQRSVLCLLGAMWVQVLVILIQGLGRTFWGIFHQCLIKMINQSTYSFYQLCANVDISKLET